MRHAKLIMLALLLIFLASGGAGWLCLPPTLGSAGFEADLNEDGKEELVALNNGRLTVSQGQDVLWRSPKSWRIARVTVADANNDGHKELVMVLWKRGSFGPSKPMWLTREDKAVSSHLFLYRLQDDRMRPVWCSSALDRPIIELTPITGTDGSCSLGIIEGPAPGPFYLVRQLMVQNHTRWQWQEWGFWKM